MKQDNLVDEIYLCLNHDDIDLVQAASRLGTDALPYLKKIITANNQHSAKAQILQKVIRLFWNIPDLPVKQKKPRRERFAAGMRSISTNSPEEHIKGFGSDMLRGKR